MEATRTKKLEHCKDCNTVSVFTVNSLGYFHKRCDSCHRKKKNLKCKELVDSGICPSCGKLANNGKTRCDKCLDKASMAARHRYKTRKENAYCFHCNVPNNNGKPNCDSCLNKRAIRRNQRHKEFKKKAVEYLGGMCAVCLLKTDKHYLFDFHHIARVLKFKDITRMIAENYSWEQIQEELDKCVLLCCRCHRIRHNEASRQPLLNI